MADVKRRLKDKYLDANDSHIIQDYKLELNTDTGNQEEVPSNLLFKYAPGIAFEELIVIVNEYFKNLNHLCHISAISGGATLTLESQPFPYKGQYTNITIPVKIYKHKKSYDTGRKNCNF